MRTRRLRARWENMGAVIINAVTRTNGQTKVWNISTISATKNVMALKGDRSDAFENVVEVLSQHRDLPLAEND